MVTGVREGGACGSKADVWQLLQRTEDPRSIAAFRVALGSCLLLDVLTLWPHRVYLYAEDGIAPSADACVEGLRSLSLLCHVPGASAATTLLLALIGSAAMFTVGAFTRVTKWVTAALFASLVLRNGLPLAGEQVLGSYLFLLCLSRCGAAYSVDQWLERRGGRARVLEIPAWPRALMIAQFCVAYGVAGWAKTGQTYTDGSAFYWIVANDRWYRFEPWWLLSTFGTNALRWATWIAVWFERTVPLVGVALWLGTRWRPRAWRAARWIWVPLSFVFTGTLVGLTNIGWFVPATMFSALVLFRGEEVGRVLARCSRRPFVPATRSAATRPRWVMVAVALMIGWHGIATIVNALDLPHLRVDVPPALRSATKTWARITNTPQFWGMFSPNAPRARSWLIVDVVNQSGEVEPAFDDRVLIGQRAHPYVFIDRRQKVHGKLQGRNRAARARYARYVCAHWRDEEHRPPREVLLSRWIWPLPKPEWMAAHGPSDPRPDAEPYRREIELLAWDCERGTAKSSMERDDVG